MPAAPANPYTLLACYGQPFVVLVGPDDGSDVTNEDVDSDVELVSLSRSAGGRHLDHATLHFSLANSQTELVDKKTPFDFSRRVQVRLQSDDGEPAPGKAVFSGELATETAKIARGEWCQLLARIEPWHFGDPLLGPKVRDADNETTLTPHVDIVFNPEIDGRIEPNMSDHIDVDDDWHLWVDPESVRTAAAKTVAGEESVIESWDLANAVYSLCFACNPAEDLIVNPTLEDLQGVFGDDAPALRNVKLRRGRRLPELLDDLLPKFGFSWYLQPGPDTTDADATVSNTIRVFQLGAGRKVQVFLQRPTQPPAALDLAKSNATDLEVTWNIADLANEIVGQGSLKEVEATFELYRGWPEADDALSADDLRKTEATLTDDPDEPSQFQAKPDVWRKWVLNEAGDYCNSRTVVAPIGAEPFAFGRQLFSVAAVTSGGAGAASFKVAGDHTAVMTIGQQIQIAGSTGNDDVYTIAGFSFGGGNTTIDVVEAVPSSTADGELILAGLLGLNTPVKRRRFHHCLTWGADLERRDVFVQYRDPDVAGDTDPGAWKAFPHETWSNIGFHVLHKEAGIYFSGSTPPPDLMDLGDDARLRITATLRADERLEARAAKGLISPQLNTIQLFVDLGDRFHYRQIQTTGTYRSALYLEPYGDDTDDDTTLLQEYVTALQSIEESARVSSEFELFGIQTGYEIGDVVTKVNGREISLNRNSWLQAEKLYPQITAITYDRGRQTTRLRVETYDFTTPQIRKLSM